MEVKPEYSLLCSCVSETIDQLSKIIFAANSCMEMLKKSLNDAEEIFLADVDNENDTENE